MRSYRRQRSILVASLAALVLTAFQAYLGKVTVETSNSGESVTTHLAVAMLLLATFTFIAVRARYPGSLPRRGTSQRMTLVVAFTAISVYALLLFGAHVTSTGAALVYPDWPFFGGAAVPATLQRSGRRRAPDEPVPAPAGGRDRGTHPASARP